jgi:hypothetical protein
VASGQSGLSATNVANPTVSGVSSNTYTVTVTDGCSPQGTASGSVTRTVLASPVASISTSPGNAIFCGGSTPVSLTASGGVSTIWTPFSTLWTDAAATTTPYTENTNASTVYAKPTGNTTYTATVTAANGCRATATQMVEVSTPPTVTATASPQNVCSGSTSTLTATASAVTKVSNYTFQATAGTYTEITGTTITSATAAGELDSYVSGAITIPAFTFAGVTYTTAYVSSNGFLNLGGSAPISATYTTISTTTGSGISIAPLNADLITAGAGDISWTTVGNEIVFQWKNFKRYLTTGEAFSFQARLNTTNGQIRFVYGGVGASAPTFSTSTDYQPQIGFRTSPSNYLALSVTSAGSETWAAPVIATSNSATVRLTTTSVAKTFSSGLTYTFGAPPAPVLTYAWSPADLSPNSNSATGTTPPIFGTKNYTVTVSDGSCSSQATVTVQALTLTVNPTATPSPKPVPASTYTFQPSSGTYNEITGTTITSTTTVDGLDAYASGAITIPTFTFAGLPYTTAYVTSNGLLNLGGTAPGSFTSTGISTTTGSGITLAPLSADLAAAGTSNIQWTTSGNEIIFQWRNFRRYGVSGEAFSFQVRLNTANGNISYVYGGVGAAAPTFGTGTSAQPQVGIRTSTTDYLALSVTSAGSETWRHLL